MVNLLNPMLMGPAQTLQRPQATMAPQASAGAFPAAPRPSPMSGIGERLRGFLAPEIALPAAAAMMQAPDFGSSIGGAFGAMGQGLAAQRAKQEAEQKRNATLEYFKRTRPDLYEAVAVGMDPGDAFKLAMEGGPDLTDDLKEYEFAKKQGFGGSFTDYMTEMRKAGATNVTVGGGKYGTIPPGYELVEGPQGAQMRPIPGGPVAQEAEQAAASSESKEEQQRTWNLIVNDEIGRALNVVENGSILPTTGLGSETMAGIGGTAARDLKGLLDTVKANAGFDRLQAMRDASPTGGALGQVSERELAFLQSTIGNLEQSQSKEQLTYNLKRLKKIYENMLSGKRAYDGLLEQSDGTTKEGWQDLGNGVRIRKLD